MIFNNKSETSHVITEKNSCTTRHVSSWQRCLLKIRIDRMENVRKTIRISLNLSCSRIQRATRPPHKKKKTKRRRDRQLIPSCCIIIKVREEINDEFRSCWSRILITKFFHITTEFPNLFDVLGRMNSQHSWRLTGRSLTRSANIQGHNDLITVPNVKYSSKDTGHEIKASFDSTQSSVAILQEVS